MKIIRKGKVPQLRSTCKNCGCIFTYSETECKVAAYASMRTIACPECKLEIHTFRDKPEDRIDLYELPMIYYWFSENTPTDRKTLDHSEFYCKTIKDSIG